MKSPFTSKEVLAEMDEQFGDPVNRKTFKHSIRVNTMLSHYFLLLRQMEREADPIDGEYYSSIGLVEDKK